MDMLQLTHVYLLQTGSFYSYKDLPGILECYIANTCSSIAGVQNYLAQKTQNSSSSFFPSCKILYYSITLSCTIHLVKKSECLLLPADLVWKAQVCYCVPSLTNRPQDIHPSFWNQRVSATLLGDRLYEGRIA